MDNMKTFTAAGAQRFYKVQLDNLKERDQKDLNPAKGLIEEDGLKAAYVESGESFAFVSQTPEELNYGVYTPDGRVQAGSLKSNGEGWVEGNLTSLGVQTGTSATLQPQALKKPCA